MDSTPNCHSWKPTQQSMNVQGWLYWRFHGGDQGDVSFASWITLFWDVPWGSSPQDCLLVSVSPSAFSSFLRWYTPLALPDLPTSTLHGKQNTLLRNPCRTMQKCFSLSCKVKINTDPVLLIYYSNCSISHYDMNINPITSLHYISWPINTFEFERAFAVSVVWENLQYDVQWEVASWNPG